MICEAKKANIPFTHIVMDGFYGSNLWLLTLVEMEILINVADVVSDTRVYCEPPVYQIPTRKGTRERIPVHTQVVNTPFIRVDSIAKRIDKWR